MPESLPTWLISVLTGGLAAAILTLFINWRKAKNDKKQAKLAYVNALKQELLHSLWLIDYNYNRITSKELLCKALTFIKTANVERILFGTEISLPLEYDELRGYLGQMAYHNSAVAEYTALTPNGQTANYRISLLHEIAAICTPNDTYKDRLEPSPRARINKLLNDLSKIKL